MSDLKEIKSIRVVPFTLMSSSISAVLGFLYAIVLVVIMGIAGTSLSQGNLGAGTLATLALALILALPTASFLITTLQSFLETVLYNIFVPRLGGIKLELEDLNEVKSIPVVPFALMVSSIVTVLMFLVMLILGPLFMSLIQGAALSGRISGVESLGALGILGILIMIIGVPIATFVVVFIVSALTAIFYNLLAPKIGGIQLEFALLSEKLHEIRSIPVVKFAVILTVVGTILAFIFGILGMALSIAGGTSASSAALDLLINVVMNFVIGFVVYAITAALYNFLAPKIGTVKLELE